MIGGSLKSLSIMLVTALLVFVMTAQGSFNINGLPLAILGGLVYLSGLKSLGRLWSPDIKLKEGHKLIDSGLFKYIRHPMYLGIMIAGYGIAVIISSSIALLFMTLVAVPYTYLRASVEEDFLSKNLEGYSDYKKRTKMFLPKLV